MDNFQIKNLLPCEAIAWQEKLGRAGILDSNRVETALGAYIGAELVGVQTFSPRYLVGLLVKPEFRRRGIGRALMVAALDQMISCLRDGEHITTRTNRDSGSLVDSLPETYRSRIYERDWYE